MDFDKQCRDGEACRGVIKKLFPSKRYGFAVCECDKHTGEAHFNYSDLDLPEQERSCLIVGWRIEFNVIEQHKKTDHCDYRAIQVKPVSVMVVQCEFSDIWENETAALVCRELAGKIIYVTKDKYNGKFESDAIARRDTCRAAVTWEEIKQKKTVAIHCSQDTISPTTGSPYRPKFKTPEKRTRRDGQSFSESTTAPNLGDDIFKPVACDQINQTFTRGHDSGLVSPDDQQMGSKTLGTPLVRVFRTSTPKTERFPQLYDGSRITSLLKTSPAHSGNNNSNSNNNSSGNTNNASCSSHGNITNLNSSSNSNNTGLNNCGGNNNINNNNNDINRSSSGSGSSHNNNSASMLQHSFALSDSISRDSRSAASRRNLEREFDYFCVQSQDNKKVHSSSPKNPVYLDTTKIMSLLTMSEQTGLDDSRNLTSSTNQAAHCMNSVFGLYDANRTHDEIDVYSVRNHSSNSGSFKPSWETSQNSLISHTVDHQLHLHQQQLQQQQQQQQIGSHRRSLEKLDLLYRHSTEGYFGEANLNSTANLERKASR